jgi:hypothetical protein
MKKPIFTSCSRLAVIPVCYLIETFLIFSLAAKEYAFAFCPLTTSQGPVVSDGEHKLQVYSLPKNESDSTFYLKDTASTL